MNKERVADRFVAIAALIFLKVHLGDGQETASSFNRLKLPGRAGPASKYRIHDTAQAVQAARAATNA
jgi:hypothetical protein